MPSGNLKFQISNPNLLIILLLAAALTGCSNLSPTTPSLVAEPPTTQSTSADAPNDWSIVAQTLGRKGVLHDSVYTITIPRTDLFVAIEGMDVPAAAGIATEFNFYRCSCGKSVVIGQFVCADYEANDVLLALQQHDILVSSVGPFLLYEKPRLLAIRFQSEGDPEKQSDALKTALSWTAKHTTPGRRSDE